MIAEFEGPGCESEAARLLPWFATGRLSAPDTERVRAHLEHCALCRTDLGHEQAVRAALKGDECIEYAPQAGIAKTLARIDELARDAPTGEPAHDAGRAPRRFTATRWLTAAVIVQTIGLGVFGAALLGRSAQERAEPRYQTLSAPTPRAAGPRIRAVFEPATTLAELRSLLSAERLLIVDGPSAAGAYTLVAEGGGGPAALDSALARLRADRRVMFAEPAVNDAAAAR